MIEQTIAWEYLLGICVLILVAFLISRWRKEKRAGMAIGRRRARDILFP